MARNKKRVRLTSISTAIKLEVPLTHSQMLKARRKKQATRKHLAGISKRAKKLGKQNAKMVGTGVLKTVSA